MAAQVRGGARQHTGCVALGKRRRRGYERKRGVVGGRGGAENSRGVVALLVRTWLSQRGAGAVGGNATSGSGVGTAGRLRPPTAPRLRSYPRPLVQGQGSQRGRQ